MFEKRSLVNINLGGFFNFHGRHRHYLCGFERNIFFLKNNLRRDGDKKCALMCVLRKKEKEIYNDDALYNDFSILMISRMPSFISLTAWNSVKPMRLLFEIS